MKKKFISFNLLHYDNIYILKQNKINILYSFNYFFCGALNKNNNIYFDKSTNITLNNNVTANNNYKQNKIMKQFLFKISYFFFKKIKFTGKGYRIKKSFKKSFKFFFGYSHNVYIVYGGLVIKKISKYKILLLSNNKKKINKINKIIINIKKINIYTKRGLRGMQQLIFKRSGKKSTY